MLNIKKLLTKILTSFVKKTGDTMSGDLTLNKLVANSYIDVKNGRNITIYSDQNIDDTRTSDYWNSYFQVYDKDNTQGGPVTGINTIFGTDGASRVTLHATRKNGSGTRVGNQLNLMQKADGTRLVSVSDPAAWRNALDVYSRAVTSYTHTDFGYTSNTQAYATSGSNQPRAYKHGRVVTLTGCIKNTSGLAATSDAVQIGSVPSDCKPISQYKVVAQGSGMNRFLLTIETDGKIQLARYGTTSSINVPANSWLNIGCTYISAS